MRAILRACVAVTIVVLCVALSSASAESPVPRGRVIVLYDCPSDATVIGFGDGRVFGRSYGWGTGHGFGAGFGMGTGFGFNGGTAGGYSARYRYR